MKFTILFFLIAINQIGAAEVNEGERSEVDISAAGRKSPNPRPHKVNNTLKWSSFKNKVNFTKNTASNKDKKPAIPQKTKTDVMKDAPKYLPQLPNIPPKYNPSSVNTQPSASQNPNPNPGPQIPIKLPDIPTPYNPSMPNVNIQPLASQNPIPDSQNPLQLPDIPPSYNTSMPNVNIQPLSASQNPIPDSQNPLQLPDIPPSYNPSMTNVNIQPLASQNLKPDLQNSLQLPDIAPPYNTNNDMIKPQNLEMNDLLQFQKTLNQSMLQLLITQQKAAEKMQLAATQNLNPQTGSQQTFTPIKQFNVPMVKPMTAKEIVGSKPMAAQITDRYMPYYPYNQGTPDCCQADVIEALCNSKVEPLLQNLIRLSNGQVYYFSPPLTAATPGKNWYQAQDFCRSYGMQLVSVETAAENILIKNQVAVLLSGVSTGSFWTSLNDLSVEGSYMWAGVGEPASPIPFQSIAPSGVTADCGQIIKYPNTLDQIPVDPVLPVVRNTRQAVFVPLTNIVWNDQNCNRKTRFICEMICPCDELINII